MSEDDIVSISQECSKARNDRKNVCSTCHKLNEAINQTSI
jgi:hypothetical protein